MLPEVITEDRRKDCRCPNRGRMPEQAHEIVTEQAFGPIFEQAHGPMFEQANGLETDQLEETREHVRAVLYEKLLSLDPKQVREMLANHVRGCTAPCADPVVHAFAPVDPGTYDDQLDFPD